MLWMHEWLTCFPRYRISPYTVEPLYIGLHYTGPPSIAVKNPVRKPYPTVDEGALYTG